MLRILHNTHFAFMKYRRFWVALSTVLNLAVIGMIFVGPGIKYGVDFSGGTQVTVKFKAQPDVARVRRALEALNLGNVSIQPFDEAERHELLIRMQNPGEEGDFSSDIIGALDREFNAQQGALRLNIQGVDAVRDQLAEADPDRVGGGLETRRAHYGDMARAILELRKQRGILQGPGDLQAAAEVSPAVRTFLADNARFGEFSILAIDNVGPAVGKDLREKATYAIGFSLLGMLVYMWFRFQLEYGVGALVALAHDTLMALGALVVTGRDIDIPVVAALLTLVGYSVNDKVVIFDRIRERRKLDRGKSLIETMDLAINQTLSRTIITGGGVLLVLLALFFFGGDVINTFTFVLLLGVVVGTYSSIYVASPIALVVSGWFEKRRDSKRRRR